MALDDDGLWGGDLSIGAGGFDESLDSLDDFAAIQEAIKSEDPLRPTAQQQEMIDSGAFLIAKADGDTGMPTGRWAEDLAGQQVVIDPISTDENVQPARITLTLDGLNDRTIKSVLDANQHQRSEQMLGRDERISAALQAWTEIGRRKRAARQVQSQPPRARPASNGAAMPSEPTQPPPEKPIQIVFDFGRMGKQVGVYVDAFIHDKLLVLIGDPRVGHVYIPPPPDEIGEPIVVLIPGLEQAVRVLPTGVGYPYRGRLHCLLAVVRSDEGIG